MAFNDVGSYTEGLVQKTVETWESFERELKILRENASGQLLFRGQEDSCWPLTTTLERNKQPRMLLHEYYRLMLKVRPQIEAFTGNHWVIPTYPSVLKWTKEYDEFSLRLTGGRLPGYDYMVYLRHHGFPSPLIDWTRSLHVAAYFAFRNAAGDEADKKVSIYVFWEGKFRSGSNKTPFIFRLGPYVRTHRRHFLQQSEYTLCIGFEDNQWRFEPYQKVFDLPRIHQGTFWKFDIPSTERLKVLKVLDEYNLNAFSLLNSEESLVETMALREFHFNGST